MEQTTRPSHPNQPDLGKLRSLEFQVESVGVEIWVAFGLLYQERQLLMLL